MPPKGRRSERVIVHFDYDCFYASVFEHENPQLKSLPLAVQQKQIIVTCNYEARRRGLRKLQLITEARKLVPDVVIVLGEELGRFRDASKALYNFLAAFTWSGRVERLGFDEVFMDVTDMVDYNAALLNPHDLTHSFFQLKQNDPTAGFHFDASHLAPHGHPVPPPPSGGQPNDILLTRLTLASHFARHARLRLEEEKGYTATVGISTNKLLSKLIGNLNKPNGQTTLLPPYVTAEDDVESNVTTFIDGHDIGKIPGIGFKMSQKLRNHFLSRAADFDDGLIWGATKEAVSVRDVRLYPGMGPETLEKLLGGRGAEQGIGARVWGLLHGIDDTEVQQMKRVPTQISIEDSYIRLDTMPQVQKELRMLTNSLMKRLHKDLLEDDEDSDPVTKRWIALPKTIRLSTRPRPPLNADGTRTRSFQRISRSGPLPSFVFNLVTSIDAIIEKLVTETLTPMFRRLHPQPEGWNLSLMNIGVTNMVETASDEGKGKGRDIGKMFRRQEDVLREWRVEDRDVPPDFAADVSQACETGILHRAEHEDTKMAENESYDVAGRRGYEAHPSAGRAFATTATATGSEDILPPTQISLEDNEWEEEDDDDANSARCHVCGAIMPPFAMAAHQRFHSLPD